MVKGNQIYFAFEKDNGTLWAENRFIWSEIEKDIYRREVRPLSPVCGVCAVYLYALGVLRPIDSSRRRSMKLSYLVDGRLPDSYMVWLLLVL